MSNTKPTPPAYAIGFDPSDYDLSNHRIVEVAEGFAAVQINQSTQTQEEDTMAKIVKTTPAAVTKTSAKAPATEKEVKVPTPKFSKECTEMLLETKYTDEEISEALAPKYPDLKDTSPGAVNYYRKLLNAKRVIEGLPELEKLVKNDKGKTVPVSQYTPAPSKEAAPAPAPAKKEVAAPAPVKKVAIKKK